MMSWRQTANEIPHVGYTDNLDTVIRISFLSFTSPRWDSGNWPDVSHDGSYVMLRVLRSISQIYTGRA